MLFLRISNYNHSNIIDVHIKKVTDNLYGPVYYFTDTQHVKRVTGFLT